MSARQDATEGMRELLRKLRVQGLTATVSRIAEYYLTLPENREALLAKRAAEDAGT